jgi:hypothetical protein
MSGLDSHGRSQIPRHHRYHDCNRRAVTSGDPVTVAITAAGGVVTGAQELFATSQFFDVSDDDRLSKPAFLPFDAGATLEGGAWQVSDAKTAAVVYEESLGEDDVGTGRSTSTCRLYVQVDRFPMAYPATKSQALGQ